MGYIANYGYTDGSGDYYISVNTDKCDGCNKCVNACPQQIFEIVMDDYDNLVAKVRDQLVKEIKYLCAPCKPAGGVELKCQTACIPGAITHSW